MATPTDNSELGDAIQDVTEKLSLLFREEIELAKTEMTEKVTKLIQGAVVGIVAGIFFVFGLIYLLHAGAWGDLRPGRGATTSGSASSSSP